MSRTSTNRFITSSIDFSVDGRIRVLSRNPSANSSNTRRTILSGGRVDSAACVLRYNVAVT